MRVDSVSVRVYSSPLRKCNSGNVTREKNSTRQFKSPEIPIFAGNNVVKGIGIGTILGIVAMGAISAASGGVATPFAFGLYAASFGTAGGIAGKAYDETKKLN